MDILKSELAKRALDIGAITLNSENPYTWASGYRMPIYNDNRKHLRYVMNRQLITDAFISLIKKNNIPLEAVAGTSTAGIAPAASLAQALKLPVAIVEMGVCVWEYSLEFVYSLKSKIAPGEYNLVASTCPHSIIPAVQLANEKELPFAYIRAEKKDHGLKKQIEGIVKEGDSAVLVDFHTNESYADIAKSALEEQGVVVKKIFSEKIEPAKFVEKRAVVQVEDLISTGGSCLDEIQVLRTLGNNLDHCLAIFSYDFPETLGKFKGVNCNVHSIFGYDALLQVALGQGNITPAQYEMLKEWRKAPWDWGADHGFPKVEKK